MKAHLGETLLVVFGTVLPLLLLEVLVRTLPPAVLPSALNTAIEEMNFGARRYYREDKELRHTIKPKTDLQFNHPEFTYRVKTNLNLPDAGFRGGTLVGPPWAVALGDSFTFGVGVNQQETWVARLAALAKRDVINLGVSGYGPIQYTRTLERYGIPLSPKVIFYALYTNDLDDCVNFEQWLSGYRRPISVKRFLRENSVTYKLFTRLTGLRKSKSRYLEVPEVGVMLIPRKLKDPYDLGKSKYDLGWTLAARQIDKAHEYSRRINAKFVLLYFPSKEEVYWDRVKARAKRFSAFEEWRDKLRNTVGEFCAERRFYCHDLSTSLRSRGSRREKLYFPIDIHWNENGNRVVAEEIYKFLIDAKIL